MDAEWTLTLRQVFQDVQLQAVEASSYLHNSSGVTHQRTLIPAVRRLNALFSDEVHDGERTVVEEAFVVFLNEMWLAVARVLVAPKVSDVVLLAIAAFVGDFLRRTSNKSKELTGKAELRLEVLKRLMDATKAEDRSVRLRACHMLQIIVNRLEFIEKELVVQLKETLLLRLKDKVTSVRIQSIYGLKRFQDADGHDTIAREFNSLMVADPSKDVRKAALSTLILSSVDYNELLVRIRDASEDVRVAAFSTITNAVAFNDLALKDRVHLLDQGLHDRSLRVRKACEQMVVTQWLPACDSSPLLLLKALAIAEYPAIGSKVARLVIHHVATQPRGSGPKKGDLNALEMMSKTSDAFTLESVFFWREQCLYYQKIDKDMDQVAALVPNVSEFSNMLVATCKAETNVLDIAQQLLELGHLLDLQDEVGRRNLLDALQNLLRDLETESQLIKGIMELLAFIYSSSSEQEFIQVVAEIVSDMYDAVETDGAALQHEDSSSAIDFGPQVHKLSDEDREAAEVKLEELEKQLETLESESEDYTKVQTEMAALETLLQDPRVVSWLRCLEIVAQLLKLTSHNLSDPIVDGMGRYILPAIDSDVPALREAGLENLGLYCLLDKRLAERYLIVFWRALNNPEEEREVKHTCVQAIMDMAFSFTKLQPHIFGTPQVKADPIDEDGSAERNQENQAPNQGDKEKNSDRALDREVTKKNEVEANGSVEKLDLDTIFIGLGQLVSVDDVDLQSTIVEGFCRLFMMNRIDNITVLAILLETYFCPELQKVQRQHEHGFQSRSLQVLSLFFSAFVLATSANGLLLEEAATHLMQKCMEKVESDVVFDLPACAKYVLHLLRQPAHDNSDEKPSHGSENRSSAHHNRIGISMCLEVLALADVAALPSIRSELVMMRQKTLVKMLAHVDVTVAEPRSAALFQYLLQAIASTCFASQKGLLRSVDAMIKRTTGTLAALHESDVARAQDQAWAHELVQERASVLSKVLVEASKEVEKSVKKQGREKKRRTCRLAASTSESESDEEDETRTLRRHVSARRSKTAAVSRMQEKEGEFDAKIQRALDQDRRTSESEEMSESESEEESE